MEREVDYVLKRLDEWNYNIIKRNYSRELCDKIAKYVTDIAKREFGEEFKEFEEIWHEMAERLSFDKILEESKGFVSRNHSIIESILEGKNIPSSFNSISEGVRNEYFNPLFEGFRKYKKFVDSIREQSSRKFPSEIEDEDITNCFSKVFPKVEDYSDYVNNVLDLSLPVIDIDPRLNSSDKNALRKMAYLIKGINRALIKEVYGSLYSS